MTQRIVIIQGNPDPAPARFAHALASAYQRGAERAGRQVDWIEVGCLEFPVLRSREEWQDGKPVPAIRHAQDLISRADHLVIIYPLWLGEMPALLKAFLEQVFRPGYAIDQTATARWKKRLAGRSARIIVTMGMPAWAYRWFFMAHSLTSLKRNILHFCGIRPVRTTLIGMVDGNPARREKWLGKVELLGKQGR